MSTSGRAPSLIAALLIEASVPVSATVSAAWSMNFSTSAVSANSVRTAGAVTAETSPSHWACSRHGVSMIDSWQHNRTVCRQTWKIWFSWSSSEEKSPRSTNG